VKHVYSVDISIQNHIQWAYLVIHELFSVGEFLVVYRSCLCHGFFSLIYEVVIIFVYSGIYRINVYVIRCAFYSAPIFKLEYFQWKRIVPILRNNSQGVISFLSNFKWHWNTCIVNEQMKIKISLHFAIIPFRFIICVAWTIYKLAWTNEFL
jgi:hypothetical protein